MSAQYEHGPVEAKWQARWAERKTFATPKDRTRPKYYVLDMFPYPSGDGLHVGHPKGYSATDVVARAKRMQGFNVLRVMGWDSFGLPTERQADKEDKRPQEITARNVGTFRTQLQRLGLSYDWEHELATSDPRYYRWTQWIFLKLHERGLAYRSEVAVNWCPAQGTVLANEEVKDGVYVDTGDPVERRMMRQWMLRITAYADRLVDDLEGLDWPEGIKKQQRDWIGRSEGAEVEFQTPGGPFRVFTTRPDTLFGCTYAVLAPEHALVDVITTADQKDVIAAYRAEVGKKSDRDRNSQAADAPKTGCFTGAYATNPVNGEQVPVWIADYVLGGYGTGAVFACPAHDERDHAFATAQELEIREVVLGGDVDQEAYAGDGPHVNSGFLDGQDVATAKKTVIAWLEANGKGKGVVNYRLRDWLFSRQRYWGEPFPTIELPDGTVKPLPEDMLPVELPDVAHAADRKAGADGRPPLAQVKEWVNTTDPDTGLPAVRETNTMPQWAGSCWYYLRFLDPKRDDVAWDAADEQYWMPVDLYVGGAEHAVLHLLYARFWHKVLYDLGLVHTKEPFQRLFNQGMIQAFSYKDARGKYHKPESVEDRGGEWFVRGSDVSVARNIEKMSKSKGNVANPLDLCNDYGADALRLYELFMGALEDSAVWETSGVSGMRRFLERSWRLVVDHETGERNAKLTTEPVDDKALDRALHAAIKKVTEAVEALRFNTAIAEMMVFVNEATRAPKLPVAHMEAFLRILSPFAPHIASDLWERLGNTEDLAWTAWPAYDPARLKADTIQVAVQVNGKLRGELSLPVDVTGEAAIAAAKADPNVVKFLTGTIRREIYVPGRLVNLVVG